MQITRYIFDFIDFKRNEREIKLFLKCEYYYINIFICCLVLIDLFDAKICFVFGKQFKITNDKLLELFTND